MQPKRNVGFFEILEAGFIGKTCIKAACQAQAPRPGHAQCRNGSEIFGAGHSVVFIDYETATRFCHSELLMTPSIIIVE